MLACLLGTLKADLQKENSHWSVCVLAVMWPVLLCKFRLVSAWIKAGWEGLSIYSLCFCLHLSKIT